MSKWLENNKLCFGVIERDSGKIVAKVWCDLKEFNFPACYRLLDDDEAYIFSSFCKPEHRGNGLAAVMRVELFKALHDRGIRRCCSYTNYFNHYARNYKTRIGSINKSLHLHLSVWGMKSNFTLKRYS